MKIGERLKRLEEERLKEKHAIVERHRLRKEVKKAMECIVIIGEKWDRIEPKKRGRSRIRDEEIERVFEACLGMRRSTVEKGVIIMRVCENILRQILVENGKAKKEYIKRTEEWKRLNEVIEGMKGEL